MKLIKDFHMTILISLIVTFLSLTNLNSEIVHKFTFFENEDKLIHFLMYFGVTITFLVEYFIRRPLKDIKYYLLGLYPVALGGLIEIVQSVFTQSRSGDWYDFMADVFGVIFAYISFHYLKNLKVVMWYINLRADH